VSYRFEWFFGPLLLGTLLVLPLAPPFALIALVLIALTAIVALAGGILVIPYLLVRSLRRHRVARRRSTEGSLPIGSVIAPRGRAAPQDITEEPS
jgi:hypothetical protein